MEKTVVDWILEDDPEAECSACVHRFADDAGVADAYVDDDGYLCASCAEPRIRQWIAQARQFALGHCRIVRDGILYEAIRDRIEELIEPAVEAAEEAALVHELPDDERDES